MQTAEISKSGEVTVLSPSEAVAKMLAYAKNYVGSTKFSGMCQSFVAHCYGAGFNSTAAYCASAKVAYKKWAKPGTYKDKKPPAGAAVFFFSSSMDYWHVALSAGYDKDAKEYMIYDPVKKGVLYHSLSKAIVYHNTSAVWYSKQGVENDRGYLGWGWEGDLVASGAEGTYTSAKSEEDEYSDKGFISKAIDEISKNPDHTIKSERTTTTVTDESGNAVADISEKTVEITQVVDNSTLAGKETLSEIRDYTNGQLSLLLQNPDGSLYTPLLTDTVKLTRYRSGQPAKLTFSCMNIPGLHVANGYAVALRWSGEPVFLGYIFSVQSAPDKLTITAYDQLRYFKNQDSFTYEGKYSDLIRSLCGKYGLDIGTIEDTGYSIPKRLEDGTLFDICATASTLTLLSRKRSYILYDDFGKICLRSIENMMLNLYVDADALETWSGTASIDSGVATRVLVAMDDDQTGVRTLYSAQDNGLIKRWGILTRYETQRDLTPALAQSRADTLLQIYGRENKSLKLNNVIGDPSVRGGSSLIVDLDLGNEEKVKQFFVVDQVEHKFDENRHLMDLKVFGGAYTA